MLSAVRTDITKATSIIDSNRGYICVKWPVVIVSLNWANNHHTVSQYLGRTSSQLTLQYKDEILRLTEGRFLFIYVFYLGGIDALIRYFQLIFASMLKDAVSNVAQPNFFAEIFKTSICSCYRGSVKQNLDSKSFLRHSSCNINLITLVQSHLINNSRSI